MKNIISSNVWGGFYIWYNYFFIFLGPHTTHPKTTYLPSRDEANSYQQVTEINFRIDHFWKVNVVLKPCIIWCAIFGAWEENVGANLQNSAPIKSIFLDAQNRPWDNVRASELGQSLSYYLSIMALHNSITNRTRGSKLPALGRQGVKILIPLMSHSK